MPTQTILIGCDDPNRTSILRNSLSQAGFTLRFFEQGSSLLDALDWKTPDLVILCNELPDISQKSITRLIRANPRLSQTYILLMGDEMKEKDRLAGFEAGADLCLTGIIQPNVLVARVKALLRRGNPVPSSAGQTPG